MELGVHNPQLSNYLLNTSFKAVIDRSDLLCNPWHGSALTDLTVSFVLLIPWKTALELAEQLNMTVRIYGLFLSFFLFFFFLF
jgi:hypothetical protein